MEELDYINHVIEGTSKQIEVSEKPFPLNIQAPEGVVVKNCRTCIYDVNVPDFSYACEECLREAEEYGNKFSQWKRGIF